MLVFVNLPLLLLPTLTQSLVRSVHDVIRRGAKKAVLQQHHGPVAAGVVDAVREAMQLQDVAVCGGDVVDLRGVTHGLNDLSLAARIDSWASKNYT